MSYTAGTSLGRLREIIGDTSETDELFSDTYLNDLLSTRNSVPQAAVMALRRILIDPDLLRRKFRGWGQVSMNSFPNMARVVEETIARILESSEDIVDASTTESAIPEADTDASGLSTDEDGWHTAGSIETYLKELGDRR